MPDEIPPPLRRICVFSGSRHGNRPEYAEAATALGELLVREGIGLVYGGATVGLMGRVAAAVLAGGGEAVGVLPRALIAREIAHPTLTELHIVDSMHQRKALMADLADGFVALPGGFGTLDELFEILTWSQLGLHGKPIGLFNAAGFFDPLLAFVDRTIAEGFVPPSNSALYCVADDALALLRKMSAWVAPPPTYKWDLPPR